MASDTPIPEGPVHLVRLTKSGSITIPKDLREELPEKAPFALEVKENSYILHFITEEDVEKIESAASKPSSQKASKKQKEPKYKTEGFEGSKYLEFSFEKSDYVLKALELAYQRFNDNLNEEAMKFVKMTIAKYVNGKTVHDSQLYLTVINFLSDVVNKKNMPNLIEYIRDILVPNIESKLIRELALQRLIVDSVNFGRYEKAKDFVDIVLKNITTYRQEELFFVMDSLKKLVKTLRDFKDVPKDTFRNVRDRLMEYCEGFVLEEEGEVEETWPPFDTDYQLQVADLLHQIRFTEDAFDIVTKVKTNLSEDSPKQDEIKAFLKELRNAPIE